MHSKLNFLFNTYSYDQLCKEQLYDILKLRQQVFVVEQNCPYLDLDGKDQSSFHVLGTLNSNELLGYTRLLPIGVSYPNHCSIGRVVTNKKVRKNGLGFELMNYSISQCNILWPSIPIKISAQCYLLRFYTNLGFKEFGSSYLEDDIPHIAMVLNC